MGLIKASHGGYYRQKTNTVDVWLALSQNRAPVCSARPSNKDKLLLIDPPPAPASQALNLRRITKKMGLKVYLEVPSSQGRVPRSFNLNSIWWWEWSGDGFILVSEDKVFVIAAVRFGGCHWTWLCCSKQRLPIHNNGSALQEVNKYFELWTWRNFIYH